MQASNIPSKVPLPFANSGTKNVIPTASQIGITPGAASLTDGFPPLTMTPIVAGGVPPAGADFNGIFNLITAIQQWQSAGGNFTYDPTFSSAVGGYPKGAVITNATYSGAWLSTADNNTTNPDTGGAGWVAAFMSGTVGQVRNLAMSVTTASATATLTADEIVVGSALAGQKYVLGSFIKTINLATTGAGGMDTGSAPTSGFVALYAIYNPTSGAAALLATNAATKQPNVYGGANMPAGYTASALLTVVPTNASSQFPVLLVRDRRITLQQATILSGSGIFVSTISYSAISTTTMPLNAVSIRGSVALTVNGSASVTVGVASNTTGIGLLTCGINNNAAAGGVSTPFEIQLGGPQSLAWYGQGNSVTVTTTYTISLSSYEI
jgi:hypothetical protein